MVKKRLSAAVLVSSTFFKSFFVAKFRFLSHFAKIVTQYFCLMWQESSKKCYQHFTGILVVFHWLYFQSNFNANAEPADLRMCWVGPQTIHLVFSHSTCALLTCLDSSVPAVISSALTGKQGVCKRTWSKLKWEARVNNDRANSSSQSHCK